MVSGRRCAEKSGRNQRHGRGPITEATRIEAATSAPVPPRAQGAVRLSVAAPVAAEGRAPAKTTTQTRLAGLRQSGSLKCLFPRTDNTGVDAVLVNTAGGITGGDRFETTARVGPGAQLTLTTQAAERAYAAQAGETGQVETRLDVAAGARLNWIPQETILFNACAFARRLTVTLAPGASALIAEPLIFGRAAMGEEVRTGRFHDRIEIRRNDRPLYLDAMRLDGDMAAHLDRPHVALGARAMVSLVYVGADAEAHLDPLRRALPPTGGVSLIGEDLLALRLLADSGYDLRQTLVPLLTRLIGGDLPKPWMI